MALSLRRSAWLDIPRLRPEAHTAPSVVICSLGRLRDRTGVGATEANFPNRREQIMSNGSCRYIFVVIVLFSLLVPIWSWATGSSEPTPAGNHAAGKSKTP